MADVLMYTKMMCPFCSRAKALLKSKGATIREIDATFKPKVRAEMIEKSGGPSTYPQIFINDQHIGGCDDLHALDARGGLDPLLAS